jgi:hypothetical protein
MPTRSEEGKKLIDSLEIIPADKYCNARTENGRCRNLAGYATDHLGTGRCKFHGGLAGRPITRGLYSKQLKSNLQDEYEKLINDPLLVDLYAEFAVIKTFISKLIGDIQKELNLENDPERSTIDFWTTMDSQGNEQESVKAKTLLKYLELTSKIFTRINDAETKGKNALNIKQVRMFINLIANILNETCADCPVRQIVGQRFSKIKSPLMGNEND